MKKLVSLMLTISLLFCCAVCVSEGTDFKSYSDEQLLKLIFDAQQEAANRKLALSADLMGGQYIAGVDIPTGKYIFKCTYKGDWWANMTVYTDKGNGRLKEWETITAEDGEFTLLLTLDENDCLSCDEPFTLTISTGIMFK